MLKFKFLISAPEPEKLCPFVSKSLHLYTISSVLVCKGVKMIMFIIVFFFNLGNRKVSFLIFIAFLVVAGAITTGVIIWALNRGTGTTPVKSTTTPVTSTTSPLTSTTTPVTSTTTHVTTTTNPETTETTPATTTITPVTITTSPGKSGKFL